MLETTLIDKNTRLAQETLEDYRIAYMSREASLYGRKEVLGGKAKFGIFGDGKEVAQVAMARAFQNGDFRSGYYRDQTFIFATGLGTVQQFFSQLYAHANPEKDIFSAGRQMNAHFSSPLVSPTGEWLDSRKTKNTSADISPTAGQMARALGLALASKKYRHSPELSQNTPFSEQGNEVSFCTIGDASTSEGVFWETINAAGVMQVPLAVFVWDDGYGISVPIKYQTTKESISQALAGFEPTETQNGVKILTVKGWDYPALRQTFEEGVRLCREAHQPVLFHVQEITQPQGHSTSGSHERYKSAERLEWEKQADGIVRLREWILSQGFATESELSELENKTKKQVREFAKKALQEFNQEVAENQQILSEILQNIIQKHPAQSAENQQLSRLYTELSKSINPTHRDLLRIGRHALRYLKNPALPETEKLQKWVLKTQNWGAEAYTTHLYSENAHAALKIQPVAPEFSENSPVRNGFEILNTYFDTILDKHPQVFAFGEDVGKIGDVNQGFAGLQAKYGEERVFDAGIREWTIAGQAIGMSMRGLRPIAEIQYLDYLIYALSPLSDDLATVRYRSAGTQQAPAIIRTRGHRLEGIWHSGSPMGMMLNSLRGVCILTPRDMTRAVGFYNTMLKSNDPAIIVECLNGYRLKETQPDNLSDFCLPVGVPELLQTGEDITLVTYGSCVRVAQEAAAQLAEFGISVELIDAQSLLPFDVHHSIVQSLQKTNRLVVLDEDMPGGASAYILQHILVTQKGYFHLDSQPLTISAQAVRPAYGSDADYFIKPSAEDVFEQIYALMQEANPAKYV